MNTRKNIDRTTEEENSNEMVPPQAPQNPQVPIEEGVMYNVEIRWAIHRWTQVLDTQVARDARVQGKSNANTIASRIRDFTRMNPHTFFGSKVEEDPHSLMKYSKFLMLWGCILKKRWNLPPTNSKMCLKCGMSNGRMGCRL